MTRTGLCCIAVVLLFPMLGCEEVAKDDPRFRVNPAELAQARQEGFGVPDASEADLVETLAASRGQYYANLQALHRYYSARGAAIKKSWVEKELASFGQIPQYQYLMPAESAQADRRATDSIQEADILYNEAMDLYRGAKALVVFTDEQKLRVALNKFNELIATYQNSDKIDDAAYYAGRAYEYFGDYEIAVVYYQRAFQWNEVTPYPARFRAAYLMDQKLHDRTAALALYRLAVQVESRYEDNVEYAQERILDLTRGQGG